MKILNVTSEIGKLKTVMLHRPGGEIENLTPKWLESLLFDDIPWLDKARVEHDTFAGVFKKAGVKVVYLADLVAESLDQSEDIKRQFIKQFISEAQVTSETLAEVISDYLWKFPNTKAMVEKTMAGILKSEVPNFVVRTLSDYIRDYPFVTDPMPNLYFTRDPFSVIGQGVAISKMSTLTRSRETIYGDYIFKYHPTYKKTIQHLYGRDELSSIEGGDILILNDKLLAVGVSQRTHPAAIEKLAKNLFYKYETTFERVLAFDIPKGRAFMHLDTVLTQVDYGKFVIHNELTKTIKVYELTKDPKRVGKLHVKPIEQSLQKILDNYLNTKVTLIPCGGGDVVASDREQWNDGANMMAIAPGEVISYERNHITNAILRNHGITVHEIPSSELSRGRGGPRCMSMPLERESI
ncbi:MAG: arginine deiminase [Tenericutes bacterium HGW-Tenericutes-1]|jgi:arginine deiminase|nr:MAG: arginine deiminase [Tenericutes bacterium HGW-Tenericutes-1]